MAADSSNSPDLLSLDPVVAEATKRFRRCSEWESTCRQNFLADYKFAHGDSDNGYQWPNRIRSNRDLDSRPCLTMNVVRQHNLQIINEAKQNKSSVAFRATGGDATKDAADLYEALWRRVEYKSDAQAAYETACEYQVNGGWGWIRVVTEYEDNKTFNQDFRVKRVWDPLSVYLDMDCQEKNCSDAKYGFVFDLVPDDQLEETYPGILESGETTEQPLGASTIEDSWNLKDHTRVCEYFRKVSKRDALVSFIDPSTRSRKEIKKSQVTSEMFKELARSSLAKTRSIEDFTVEWYLIVGQKIVDRTIWPGKYIPLIRVIGEETIIDGVLDRKGHTRGMKDAQRMYNYNASAQVEFGALQGKTPWIAAAKAVEEYETMWKTANTVNHSVLIYNNRDDEGNEVKPPARTEPPTGAPVYEAGMTTAFNQMMMTSGQWQNQMGMGGNERTGEAISRRQEQGYTAVFHFQNNYADALKFLGKQYLDVAPKLYDTKRLYKLQMEDGEDFDLLLDPGAKQALQVEMDREGKVIKRILNPRMGEFDVQSDVGPAYGTRREETVKAMTLLLTQAPALTSVIGDLMLKAMDFKEAQEAARRMKRLVPPQALGTGPSPQEQKLQLQLQTTQGLLVKALQQAGKDSLKLLGKDQLRDVQVYEAETKRIGVLQDQLPTDAEGMAQLIHQLVGDALETHLTPLITSNQNKSGETQDSVGPEGDGERTHNADTPPIVGAKKAPDGKWYVSDPSRSGKYLHVQAGS